MYPSELAAQGIVIEAITVVVINCIAPHSPVCAAVSSIISLPDSEKAKRVGGKKKIKLRLYQKQLKEQILWIGWKLFWFIVIWLICIMWPFLSNPAGKRLWGVDYWWLRIFEYADVVVSYIKSLQ